MSTAATGSFSLPPNVPAGYTLQDIAQRLAGGVMEAYNAYGNGLNNQPALSGYSNFTVIQVYEAYPSLDPFATLDAVAAVKAEATAVVRPAANVTKVVMQDQAGAYCSSSLPNNQQELSYQLLGFSAVADDNSHNILVLRGTVTFEEAKYDLLGWGTNVDCLLPSAGNNQFGDNYHGVNSQLYDFYTGDDLGAVTSLASSFQSALGALDASLPLFVGAHSLGAPLLELGMLDAYATAQANGTSLNDPVILTFGGLHLGDSKFSEAYNAALPYTLQLANLCDFVPSMVSLLPVTPTDPYVQVGSSATFVWQNWDDWANHSMECVYQRMVDDNDYWALIQYGDRTYPQ